jgi:hypothetical protein
MEINELQLLSDQTGCPICENIHYIPEAIIDLASEKDVVKFKFLPIAYNDIDNSIDIAIYDPTDLHNVDSIRIIFNDLNVNFMLMSKEKLERYIDEHYTSKKFKKQWEELLGTEENPRYRDL